MLVGIIQSTEGLDRTKMQLEGQIGSSYAKLPIYSWIQTSVLLVLSFWTQLNYTTSFPGPPALHMANHGTSQCLSSCEPIPKWISLSRCLYPSLLSSIDSVFSGGLEYTAHLFPRHCSLALKAFSNLPSSCFSDLICHSQLLPCPELSQCYASLHLEYPVPSQSGHFLCRRSLPTPISVLRHLLVLVFYSFV